ncbi:MAG TPA: class I SAM-dependent methyltransferase [Allosphingosinicella sp.]|nr:class I SAM-dependent methyltransferase [Allosphingosinicella sp.]
MTSREATSLLPRLRGTRIVGKAGRSWRDWAALLAIGIIQWPWLLRSLNGGSKEDRHALLDRLELPRDALPNLGSWKADVGLLRLVSEHIAEHQPKIMVEFGAGASTLVAARALQRAGGGRLFSFEQHEDFVEATRQWLAQYGLEAEIRAAPLMPSADWPGLWYDHGPVPECIDLLVVDGPPWTIHPLTRGAADSLFDRIAVGGTVMLDDAARPGERMVARHWRRRWPNFEFRLVNSGSKGTLVGTRLR